MRASNLSSLGVVDLTSASISLLGHNLYEPPILAPSYVELVSDVSRWIELESDVVRTIELVSDVTRTIELESDVTRMIELVSDVTRTIELVETRDYSKY